MDQNARFQIPTLEKWKDLPTDFPIISFEEEIIHEISVKENQFQQDARSVHRLILRNVEDSAKYISGYYLGYHNACCDILAL